MRETQRGRAPKRYGATLAFGGMLGALLIACGSVSEGGEDTRLTATGGAPPAAAPVQPPTPCNLDEPGTCPSGIRCNADAEGGAFCGGPSGPKREYVRCESDSECAPGLGCQMVGRTAQGSQLDRKLCLRWAAAGTECLAPERWQQGSSATKVNGKSYGYCYAPCDPVGRGDPTRHRACATGERCSLIEPALSPLLISRTPIIEGMCELAGTQPREAMCDSDSSCQVGLVCTGSTYAFCLQQCVVGDLNRACPPGRGCQALPGGPKVGDELIGSCVPTLTCDPANQSACPVGESCSLFRRFGPEAVCALRAGTLLDGDPCTETYDCSAGLVCTFGTHIGRHCTRPCKVGIDNCGGSDSRCGPYSPPSFAPSGVEYGTCLPAECDPTNPHVATNTTRACRPEHTCIYSRDYEHPIGMHPICSVPGPSGLREACVDDVDCAPNLTCSHFDTESYCLPHCRRDLGELNNPACDAAGQRKCHGFTDSELYVFQGVEYGYCGN